MEILCFCLWRPQPSNHRKAPAESVGHRPHIPWQENTHLPFLLFRIWSVLLNYSIFVTTQSLWPGRLSCHLKYLSRSRWRSRCPKSKSKNKGKNVRNITYFKGKIGWNFAANKQIYILAVVQDIGFCWNYFLDFGILNFWLDHALHIFVCEKAPVDWQAVVAVGHLVSRELRYLSYIIYPWIHQIWHFSKWHTKPFLDAGYFFV